MKIVVKSSTQHAGKEANLIASVCVGPLLGFFIIERNGKMFYVPCKWVT